MLTKTQTPSQETFSQINFETPSYLHNGSIIVATFDTGVTAGKIYNDGSCSCGTYDLHGDCVHAQSYRQQFAVAMVVPVEWQDVMVEVR